MQWHGSLEPRNIMRADCRCAPACRRSGKRRYHTRGGRPGGQHRSWRTAFTRPRQRRGPRADTSAARRRPGGACRAHELCVAKPHCGRRAVQTKHASKLRPPQRHSRPPLLVAGSEHKAHLVGFGCAGWHHDPCRCAGAAAASASWLNWFPVCRRRGAE